MAAGLLGFLGIIGGSFLGPAAIIGGIIAAVRHHDDDDKRSLAEELESSVILAFDTTDLRGKDVAKLQGMRVDMTAADAAVVTTDEFSVKANVSMHRVHKPDGMKHGELSFIIPGLDTLAEGTFVTIDETAADDKTKADFQKVHSLLQKHKERKEISLEEAIAYMAVAM